MSSQLPGHFPVPNAASAIPNSSIPILGDPSPHFGAQMVEGWQLSGVLNCSSPQDDQAGVRKPLDRRKPFRHTHLLAADLRRKPAK